MFWYNYTHESERTKYGEKCSGLFYRVPRVIQFSGQYVGRRGEEIYSVQFLKMKRCDKSG